MAGQHRGAWVSAYMDEDALKELRTMERRFPKEFSRALNAVGFYMRKRLRDAIKAGGPDGKKWEPLSYIHATDWLEVSRRHRGLVGPLPKKRFAMQKLMPAMRYKKVHTRQGVIIGATRATSEAYLTAVQEGAELMHSSGSQPITPKMRRMFFMAGIKLRGDRIRRPKRPLIEPVAEQYSDTMTRFLIERAKVLVFGPYERRDATAKRVGLK